MKVGIYLGNFDPITLGHFDIIKRSAELVDKLVVGVIIAPAIPTEFTIDERVDMVKKVTKSISNVDVDPCIGIVEEFAREKEANILIRGLRMMTDFENELHIVQTNYQLNKELDTIFLTTSEKYSNFSSKEVRQIARQHGEVDQFLPAEIVEDVKRLYR